MPRLRLHYDKYDRPVVTVEVKPAVHYHRQFNSQPPNVVPSFLEEFLVDTGAKGCFLEEQLIASWHLPKIAPMVVLSSAGPSVTGDRFALSLRLGKGQPDSWYHDAWLVATVPSGYFAGCDFKGVIGVDLLGRGSMTYAAPATGSELFW